MALFDDPDTLFDAPDVGFDEAGEGGIPLSSGYKIWLSGGKIVTRFNSPGRIVLCPECPCPEDTGTGTGTGTGTIGDVSTVELTCCGGAVIRVSSRLVFTVLSEGFPSSVEAPACHVTPAGQAVPSYVSLGSVIETNHCGTFSIGGSGNYNIWGSELLSCSSDPTDTNYLYVGIICNTSDELMGFVAFSRAPPDLTNCGDLNFSSLFGCVGTFAKVLGCPDGATGTGTRPDADPIRWQDFLTWVGNTGDLSPCCYPANPGGILPDFCGQVRFEVTEYGPV